MMMQRNNKRVLMPTNNLALQMEDNTYQMPT